MGRIKYLIFFVVSAYFVIFVGACGRGFKALDVDTQKALEAANQTAENPKSDSSKTPIGSPPPIAVSEAWEMDIPKKYDDVGSFFRVKEIPGLNQDRIVDSLQVGDKGAAKTLQVVRGKLRLSKVSHSFESLTKQLEIKGDVVFNDGNPLAFVLSGAFGSSEILLSVSDPNSPLKNVFSATAVCSASNVAIDVQENPETIVESCKRLVLDFYYRVDNIFYTDQLIAKDVLLEGIKKTEPVAGPLAPEPGAVPEVIPEPGMSDDLSDYEKAQKKGFSDGVIDPAALEELPSVFAAPDNFDKIGKLYPDVHREIEEQKKTTQKNKKRLKAVPKLTGEEKIPDKTPPPLPVVEDGKKPTTTPAAKPAEPVKPPAQPAPQNPPANPPTTTPAKPPAATPSTPAQPPPKTDKPATPPARPAVPPTTVPAVPPTKPVTPPQAPADGERSELQKNQAWGMPHSGMKHPETKKMVYLTNSDSLLETWQKLGGSSGFEVRFPLRKRHYGTYDVINLIVNLGEWVKQNLQGAMLSISDVSAKTGGAIGYWGTNHKGERVWIGHSSHRTGMDIDIAYLVKNPKMVFNDLDNPKDIAKGNYTHPDFDGAAQWKVIKAAYEFSPIEVIYVNRRIKQEMCRQALKAGDLKSNTDTKSDAAAILTKLVVIDSNHGNHWHVRMDCNTLKSWGVQKNCISHPQPFVGPECQKVTVP